MNKYLFLVLVLLVTGCASDKEYAAYIAAQQEANRQAAAEQKPLVRLTAQPGQTITGLQSLEVYTPTSAPVIQQARGNEWASVVNTGLAITGTVVGIHAGGIAAARLADSVGRAGTAGYAHVQAPGAVTTNTMTNSTGVIGSGSYDSTHMPTIVNQPAPLVVTQPPIQVVTQPDPIVITQPPVQVVTQPPPAVVNPQPVQVCVVDAAGVLTCN